MCNMNSALYARWTALMYVNYYTALIRHDILVHLCHDILVHLLYRLLDTMAKAPSAANNLIELR